MNAQTVPHRSITLRQLVARSWWIFALGSLIVAATLVVYPVTRVPLSPARHSASAQTVQVQPAVQSVLDYLRAHSMVQSAPQSAVSLDPAQQSVLSYLRAHERLEQSPAPWHPAVQAVLDYLRAHSW